MQMGFRLSSRFACPPAVSGVDTHLGSCQTATSLQGGKEGLQLGAVAGPFVPRIRQESIGRGVAGTTAECVPNLQDLAHDRRSGPAAAAVIPGPDNRKSVV